MSITYFVNLNNDIIEFDDNEKSRYEKIITSLQNDGYKLEDIITILNRLLINCKEIKLIDKNRF